MYPDCHRTVPVRAVEPDPGAGIPAGHLRCGVAVQISLACGNNRDCRPHCRKKCLRARTFASMVGHLQNVTGYIASLIEQMSLGG